MLTEATMMFLNCPARLDPEGTVRCGLPARRPNSAPAYYLGHPAGLWVTVMRPRQRDARHGARAGHRSPDPVIFGSHWNQGSPSLCDIAFAGLAAGQLWET